MLGLGLNSLTNAGGRPLQWDPTDKAARLWLTARSQDLTIDGSNLVSSWIDRSITGANATQSTETKQPEFHSPSNTVIFTNTGAAAIDDFMLLGTQLTLEPDNGWVVAANYTSVDWDGSAQTILGDKDDNNHIVKHDASAATFSVKASGQSKTFTLDTPSALVDGTFYTVIFNCASNGLITLYIDGVAQADTETMPSTKDLYIDTLCGKGNATTATQTLGGSVKEILVFQVPFRAGDIANLHQFMKRATY